MCLLNLVKQKERCDNDNTNSVVSVIKIKNLSFRRTQKTFCKVVPFLYNIFFTFKGRVSGKRPSNGYRPTTGKL